MIHRCELVIVDEAVAGWSNEYFQPKYYLL